MPSSSSLDAHARIERRIGVLEDDLDVLAPRPQRSALEPCQVRAIEPYLPRGGIQQPQYPLPDRRLAASGLANQPERFSGGYRERDTVNRPDVGDDAPEHALVDGK